MVANHVSHKVNYRLQFIELYRNGPTKMDNYVESDALMGGVGPDREDKIGKQ